METDYKITILKKVTRNENHLRDLDENEKRMIKLMARIVVNHVVRTVEEESREERRQLKEE